MSNLVIQVHQLGKKYNIHHQVDNGRQYKALRDVIAHHTRSLTRQLVQPLGRKRQSMTHPRSEEFWALDRISFDIHQGECIGIIGRNGAGKSTLLKVLSRITEPTRGQIRIRGRIASLLEVGTGFHPELTGRENIYLNGAILGMTKVEIRRKFDEIVAFAEIEKFLDTPVKRYSSGMYVRLAFAVAAHLEPEILIVDEVLAVGDLAFQKKCLGKMGQVATQEGRTVLFVSHSIQAIAQLTQRCLWLDHGQIHFDGLTDQAIRHYLSHQRTIADQSTHYQAPGNKLGNHVTWAKVYTSQEQGVHCWGEPIQFEFALQITEPHASLRFSFQIVNELQQALCIFWLFDEQAIFCREKGVFILRCEIPKLRLYMGTYQVRTWFSHRLSNTLLENLNNICRFDVVMHGKERPEYKWQADECVYLEDATWQTIQKFDGFYEEKCYAGEK